MHNLQAISLTTDDKILMNRHSTGMGKQQVLRATNLLVAVAHVKRPASRSSE
jgi:hypothetical protein